MEEERVPGIWMFRANVPVVYQKKFQNPKQHEIYDTLLARVLGEKEGKKDGKT